MSDVLKDYLYIALSVILTVGLLTCVVTLGTLSRDISYKKDFKDAQRLELQRYRKMAKYDDTVITGEDVVLLLTTNARVYDFKVEIAGVTSTFNRDTERALGVNIWGRQYIKDFLGSNLQSNFVSSLLKDSNGMILGVSVLLK